MRSEHYRESDLSGTQDGANSTPEEWPDNRGDASRDFKAEHRPDVSDRQTVRYGHWKDAEDDGWGDTQHQGL